MDTLTSVVPFFQFNRPSHLLLLCGLILASSALSLSRYYPPLPRNREGEVRVRLLNVRHVARPKVSKEVWTCARTTALVTAPSPCAPPPHSWLKALLSLIFLCSPWLLLFSFCCFPHPTLLTELLPPFPTWTPSRFSIPPEFSVSSRRGLFSPAPPRGGDRRRATLVAAWQTLLRFYQLSVWLVVMSTRFYYVVATKSTAFDVFCCPHHLPLKLSYIVCSLRFYMLRSLPSFLGCFASSLVQRRTLPSRRRCSVATCQEATTHEPRADRLGTFVPAPRNPSPRVGSTSPPRFFFLYWRHPDFQVTSCWISVSATDLFTQSGIIKHQRTESLPILGRSLKNNPVT